MHGCFEFLKQQKTTNIDFNNMKYLSALMCLFSVTELFISTFLLAYLFKLSGENLLPIAYYYLSLFGLAFVLSYITGFWLKNHSKMTLYRFGCFFELIFFASVWFFGENACQHVVFLGAIYAFISAFHYYPFNLLVSAGVSQNKMIKYQGYLDCVKNIIKIVSPFLLGLFLSFDSLNTIMKFLACLSVLNLLGSFCVVEKKKRHLLPYNVGAYFQKTFRKQAVRYIYLMEFFRGLALEGVLTVVVTLYIVYLFQTNFNLGSLTSLFTLATVVMNFLFGRFAKYQNFVKILIVTTVLTTATSLLFVLYPGRETFILYNLSFVTATRLLLMITSVNMFNGANIQGVKMLFKTEYFAVREMFLNMGRLVGFFGLLIVASYQNFELLRYFLLLLTLFTAVMGFCSVLINKTLFQKQYYFESRASANA